MEIQPFRAYRFEANVVGDVGDCIAPPYDVIDADQQRQLYEKNPYNIVRITRGKTTSCDDEQHNQYTRAAEYLTQWIQQGALKQDARETIYGYVQDFEIDGVAFERLTFIALGKLEDFGKTVKPHEQVFAKPMLDRLNLKKATAARFGLVFMLYEDPQGTADRIIQKTAAQKPLIDFVDDQQVRHRLFAITAKGEIEAVRQMMDEKSCIIADGHHRYTTGLNYWRQSGNPAAAYQMMAFTNLKQEGLVVLATHRVAGGIEGFTPQTFLQKLQGEFDIVEFRFTPQDEDKALARQKMLAEMKSLHEKDRVAFGVYMAGGAFHIAVLKDKQLMAAVAPDRSEAWRTLDVSVLQKLVLEELLGIDEERMGNPDCVEYVKDVPNAIGEIITRIDTAQKQVAFFTNPVKMQQLVAVTDTGERMPHKTTYFFPKMYTGLTIQKL
ncbi:MAG: DUF1015 domain-containing protein [Planctomycetota bacterium]|nr:DUF1015 domain-containing protein [Planctomycetota bacterium]